MAAGDQCSQVAIELHDSRQAPGTVTIIPCAWRDQRPLTACLGPETPRLSSQARPATPHDIKRTITTALDHFGAA